MWCLRVEHPFPRLIMHAIDRFSEDIDITFEEHLGEARRKKIKYQLLQPISEDLDLAIDN